MYKTLPVLPMLSPFWQKQQQETGNGFETGFGK